MTPELPAIARACMAVHKVANARAIPLAHAVSNSERPEGQDAGRQRAARFRGRVVTIAGALLLAKLVGTAISPT